MQHENSFFLIAITVTYIPYMAAELPSNLMLKRIGPKIQLPIMMLLWGLVSTCQSQVNSYSGLLACRFFIGLFEGGLFPGLVLYLSGASNSRWAIFLRSRTFECFLWFACNRHPADGRTSGYAWLAGME
jgi:MFS family permease